LIDGTGLEEKTTMKYPDLKTAFFTAGLMLLFLSPPLRGEELNMNCTRDMDCPPGYVCKQNTCVTDSGEENLCDPLSEKNGSCPDSDVNLDELESRIRSGKKNTDTKWDF